MAGNYQDCVILLGDSLTQRQEVPRNLTERMSQSYVRKLDVLNRGFGGFNSAGIKTLFDQTFAKKGNASIAPVVRLVTLWLGVNDATLPPNGASLPIDEFKENMSHLMSNLTSAESPYAIADTPVSIILITPGPVFPSMFEPGSGKENWCQPEPTNLFRDAVLMLGQEWKERELKEREAKGSTAKSWAIETIDFWGDVVSAAGGEGEYVRPFLRDGVHLTSVLRLQHMHDVLWDSIDNLIHTRFQGRGLGWRDEADLPLRVPLAANVDWKRPESIIDGMALPEFRLSD